MELVDQVPVPSRVTLTPFRVLRLPVKAVPLLVTVKVESLWSPIKLVSADKLSGCRCRRP